MCASFICAAARGVTQPAGIPRPAVLVVDFRKDCLASFIGLSSLPERAAAPRLAEPARPPYRRAGAVRLRESRTHFLHLGEERLDRYRYPTDRCCLQPARARVGPVPDAA